VVPRLRGREAGTLGGQTGYPTVLGSTALDIARRLGREDVVEHLRSRGAEESPATPEDTFVFAAAAGDAAAGRSQRYFAERISCKPRSPRFR